MDIARQLINENNSLLIINETNQMGNITQFVSFNTYKVFLLINGFGLTGSISIFGIFSNSLNIIVYLKLGLRETTNISFFALGIADWLVSVCSSLTVISHLQEISPYGAAVTHLDFQVLVVMFPCMGLGAWVIVLLSAERCLCIVMPLKVKTVVTRRRILCLISGMIVYQTAFAALMLILVDSPDKTSQTRLLLILCFVSIPVFVCFVLVLFFTSFMVIRLRQSLEWRTATSTQSTKTSGAKERKVVWSVLWICVMFIVCFTPFVAYFISSIVYPRLNLWDPYYAFNTSPHGQPDHLQQQSRWMLVCRAKVEKIYTITISSTISTHTTKLQ
ncbi:hypothetical protein RRG08_008074 [Elysia crispata]|uniref:G-protein coupled receptors family 1 profile domain-containing protein n=1 Tax=Elysia crispata TaxID=231223 RepID=A0AAE1DBR0_9GAST|nr:hypothetical protein RRG08_008074 [Elysia crispata]